jgi:hypothetical protein
MAFRGRTDIQPRRCFYPAVGHWSASASHSSLGVAGGVGVGDEVSPTPGFSDTDSEGDGGGGDGGGGDGGGGGFDETRVDGPDDVGTLDAPGLTLGVADPLAGGVGTRVTVPLGPIEMPGDVTGAPKRTSPLSRCSTGSDGWPGAADTYVSQVLLLSFKTICGWLLSV